MRAEGLDSPLIPKLVRGLLDQRRSGRWGNTQDNCWALLALDHYFRTQEKARPEFLARVWLGQRLAGQQEFRGRDQDQFELRLPWSQAEGNVVLAKEGPGKMYYRVAAEYVQSDPAEAVHGFSVRRQYSGEQVRQDPDGTWHVKAGSEVRVTLTMRVPARRYHVALTDALPAGFEPLSPSAQEKERRWYGHRNLRDDRVELFVEDLSQGVYTYTYLARATTQGDFLAPPARAEEMYRPETYGRSARERVLVE